ncbi:MULTISPECIES: I78 family peptidase inhibitor [unclassified Sphingomonas]|jgi:Peptidase inhibitor I78 family|uniref:I78 family peptidase inhibitor n=1 Tax=unclassified Sphingomonas TaxID=196159 RepID=UPI000AD351CE|nr:MULTISPECIES: I78 family peptidase inhibitor [unclassified Sphingomonas]
MIRLVLPAAALLVLGACAPETPPRAIPGVECSAERLGALTGKPRGQEAEAEALRLSGAKIVRWLEPDAVATMDFRPDRLNLHLGADGKINSAHCG